MDYDQLPNDEPAGMTLAILALLRGIPDDRWTDGPVTDRGIRLHRLLALGAVIDDLTDQINESLIGDMEGDVVDVPGMGRLHREEVTSSAWSDSHARERMQDDLTQAVARVVARDVATGEVNPMKRNVAIHTMRTALAAIPSFSTLLKAGRTQLGLHIDDYRTYATHYKVTVEAIEDEG